MFALTNRPFRNAGLALYGLGSLASLGLVSNQVSAQTMASNNQPEKAAYLAAKCDHLYSKPPEHVGCYAQEALNWERARGVAAERRGAEADRRNVEADKRSTEASQRADCTASFIAEIKSSPTRLEAARTLLGGKSIRDVDPCAVLSQLRKG